MLADVRPWRISRTVVMAPRLQSDRAVAAADVAQQIVAGVRLDLDLVDPARSSKPQPA